MPFTSNRCLYSNLINVEANRQKSRIDLNKTKAGRNALLKTRRDTNNIISHSFFRINYYKDDSPQKERTTSL